MKRFSFKSLLVMMVAAITLGLSVTACGNDEEPEAPKKSRFIRFMVESNLVSIRYFMDGRMNVSMDPYRTLYTLTKNSVTFQELLARYHDTGIDRELTRDELLYCPLAYPITSIELKLVQATEFNYNPDKIISEIDESNLDNFKIKFLTYEPYIKNNYTWLEDMNEWQQYTVREFNERAPHALVDIRDIAIHYNSAKYAQLAKTTAGVYYVRITFNFENGKSASGSIPLIESMFKDDY